MIGWIACLFSVTGMVLNAQKNMWCWLAYTIGSILWIIDSLAHGNMPSVALFSLYCVLNLYGWWAWTKDDRDNKRAFEKGVEVLEKYKDALRH